MDNIRRFTELIDKSRQTFTLMVGPCGSGKSTAAQYYQKYLEQVLGVEFGVLFSGTGSFNNDWDHLTAPHWRKFDTYDDKLLDRYLDGLRALSAEQKGIALPPSLVIFDDVQGILTSESKIFQRFVTTHRHLNIHILILVQYPTAISTITRSMINHACIFRVTDLAALRNLWSAFGQCMGIGEFKNLILTRTVEKYTCLWYQVTETDLSKNFTRLRFPQMSMLLNPL